MKLYYMPGACSIGIHVLLEEIGKPYDLQKIDGAKQEQYGPDFVKFLRKNFECTDLLFRLAEKTGVVLMHGGGFGGPDWSVRVSLANLPEETYPKIGQYLKEAAEGYVQEWKGSKESKKRKR